MENLDLNWLKFMQRYISQNTFLERQKIPFFDQMGTLDFFCPKFMLPYMWWSTLTIFGNFIAW